MTVGSTLPTTPVKYNYFMGIFSGRPLQYTETEKFIAIALTLDEKVWCYNIIIILLSTETGSVSHSSKVQNDTSSNNNACPYAHVATYIIIMWSIL